MPVLPAGHVVTGTDLLLGPLGYLTNVQFYRNNGLAFTTASTSYVNLTGASLAYNKNGSAAGSNLAVLIAATGFRTVTALLLTAIGVNVAGTDTDVALLTFNSLSVHAPIVGFNLVTGVGSGAQTVQVRVKTAAGTFNSDAGDQLNMIVAEVPL